MNPAGAPPTVFVIDDEDDMLAAAVATGHTGPGELVTGEDDKLSPTWPSFPP
jgi:hypothetical protein